MTTRGPSTAEVLAQFARELDAQTMPVFIKDGEHGGVRDVPVFSEATRDALVVEACRIMVADGLDLVELPEH